MLKPNRSSHEIKKLLWSCFSLWASYITTFTKPCQIFITACLYAIMTSRQVSWFSDQICFLYNLITTGSQVCGYVSSTWSLKFRVRSWIRYQRMVNNMNIFFSFIIFHSSNVLQFNFQLSKNSIKWNKLTKYSKTLRNGTKLHMCSTCHVGCQWKNFGRKRGKNSTYFAECLNLALGKE